MTTIYVVRDADGEYISGKREGERTPAGNEAFEFATRGEAQSACTRATDKIFIRIEDWPPVSFIPPMD